MEAKKITLPLAIVVSAVVLAVAYYAVQANKQESIERQRMLELNQQKDVEEEKARQVKEQADKEYAAKRKNDCLNIYKTESDKWNNVRGWRYSESEDNCFIRYRDQNPKSDAQCDEMYSTDGDYGYFNLRQNSLCKEGEFENSF